jgi:LuxR family transcriptional regulator, regulator of acetate metabolism
MAATRELTGLLAELQRLQRELIEQAYVRRSDTLDRVGEALRRLGEVGSPAGVLARAPEELARSADFDRVIVSRLEGEQLRPLGAWPADAILDDRSVVIRYPHVEADVAQRQDAQLVESGRRAAVADWQAYVVAAIVLEGKTVGLVHADRTASGRPLDELDLELTAHYADGLGRVFERAVLRDKLQRHRAQLESAARWIGGQMLQLETGEAARSAGDEVDLEQVLTRRELEVLELLARGQSNRMIAKDLMLGEGTVKYHVKNVLRKLQARSRAEAVTRYMRAFPEP